VASELGYITTKANRTFYGLGPDQLISPIEAFFVPTLARLQSQPERYRRIFLLICEIFAITGFLGQRNGAGKSSAANGLGKRYAGALGQRLRNLAEAARSSQIKPL
jgi:hypothetical protein